MIIIDAMLYTHTGEHMIHDCNIQYAIHEILLHTIFVGALKATITKFNSIKRFQCFHLPYSPLLLDMLVNDDDIRCCVVYTKGDD